MLEESFEYPQEFNLPAFWKYWCEDFKKNHPVFMVIARVSAELIAHLPRIFGEHTEDILAQAGKADELGRILLTLPFESFRVCTHTYPRAGTSNRSAGATVPENERDRLCHQIENLYASNKK